jgi:hypothetical protein
MPVKRPIVLESIAGWAIDETNRSRYTIAAAFQLAGLYERWIRLTAECQHKVFGFNMLGKCKFIVSDKGISVYRKVCFGTDFSDCFLTWHEVEELMKERRKLQF